MQQLEIQELPIYYGISHHMASGFFHQLLRQVILFWNPAVWAQLASHFTLAIVRAVIYLLYLLLLR